MTRAASVRQVEITRAVKAARAAGIAHPKVVIDVAAKRITIEAGAPADDQTTNEWDEVGTPASSTPTPQPQRRRKCHDDEQRPR